MIDAYGAEFADNATALDIHLWCYRHWEDNGKMLPKHEHFIYAMKLLWPEELPNGDVGLVWSDWTYRRAKAWCDHKFQTWWGPSSSGKSTDSAAIVLTHWFSAPNKTTVTICSTTRIALEKRIWREVLRLHSLVPDGVGYARKLPPRIVYEEKEDPSGVSTINGIFAVAIMQSESAESVGGNLFGVHNKYNVLVADELQGLKDIIFDAWENLSTGKEAKFLGMGNPLSRLDPLGRSSEPKSGNWNDVNPDMEEWETKGGVCLYFDGLKSPAIDDPDKYYFLLNLNQIEATAEKCGRDSQIFWSQRRGFVPPEGLTPTILTESFVGKYKIREKAVWQDSYREFAAMDPSFSSGGDNASFAYFKVGRFVDGVMGIEFDQPIVLNFEATTDGEPFMVVLANRVIDLLEKRDLDPSHFALDTTGSQNTFADMVDYQWSVRHPSDASKKCYRVNFSSSATKKPKGPDDPRMCKDVYKNRAAELQFTFREYVRNGQIRGVGDDAIIQFCSRREILAGAKGLLGVETKKEYKSRTGGQSPDESDMHVIGIDMVRNKLGIEPGAGSEERSRAKNRSKQKKIIDIAPVEESKMYSEDGIGVDSTISIGHNKILTKRERVIIMKSLFGENS